MAPPPTPSSSSSSSSTPTDSQPARPRRRPSSLHSRRSIASSFRSPPASLAPSSSLATPTLTLSHAPRRTDSGSSSSSASSSTAEMKRTLEADEARLKLVLERKELDKKGKGRAKDDVVGVPTEFGGQGGGEAGMFLKRRKVAGSRGPPPSSFSPSSFSPSSPEEAARATTVGGDGTVDQPPPVVPPAAVSPDPSLPLPASQPSWFGTWTRSASGMPPPASSSPAAVKSTGHPVVQPPPPSASTDARAAAPPPLTTTPIAPLASTRDASVPAPAERPPATGSGVAASVAAQAIAWIPKPVVSTVAALPGVRSYVVGSSDGPSHSPPPKPLPPVEPVPDPAPEPTISSSPTEVDGPSEALTSSAAVHEGHLPGAPTPASWFWPVSSARPQSAGPGALSVPDKSHLEVTIGKGLPPAALSEVTKEPQGATTSTAPRAAPAPAQSWWGYVPFVGDAPVATQAKVVAKDASTPSASTADPSAPAPEPPVALVAKPEPPPSTSSYLAPLSWIYSSATAQLTEPPAGASAAAPPSSAPASETTAPASAAQRMPSPVQTAVPGLSPAPSPSSYASWLTSVAGKAVHPRGSANPVVKSIGLGADVGEVMDIDDQPGELSTSAGSKAVGPAARGHSPPNSVRTQKSGSFFFSAISKSPSSTSLVAHGVKVAPITDSAVAGSSRRASSIRSAPPNLVLPSFDDMFQRPPRAIPPPAVSHKGGLARKTLGALGSILGSEKPSSASSQPQTPAQERIALGRERGRLLPKPLAAGVARARRKSVRRVVVLGVHGWFPTGLTRRIAGEPTGTSQAFACRMRAALDRYFAAESLDDSLDAVEDITVIPLEGDGTVISRADRLFETLTGREDWVAALRQANAILVATHSQGCPVSTLLLERLYAGGFIRSPHNAPAVFKLDDILQATSLVDAEYPKVGFLGLCGVHSGPLTYLSQSSIIGPWMRTFENAAAHELFDFQDSESATSQRYISALSAVLDNGCKMLYVASLNDQVVPVYSAIFSAAQHPNILRVLHIDGAAHDVTDFVTNLIVFCLQLRNAGLDDGGLVAHLSESVAHGLTGVGHSTAYAEDASYSLAIRYLFESGDSPAPKGSLQVDEFLASEQRNSYDIPWILRGIMEDPLVLELFGAELNDLRANFDNWAPVSQKMKDLRRKLEPLRPKQSRRTVAKSPLVAEIDGSAPAPPTAVKTEQSGRSRL